MRRTKFAVLVTSVLAAFITGTAVNAAPAGPPPAAVSVMTMQPQDIPVYFEYVGQIAGSKEVEIRSRVSGIIDERLYDEGVHVKQGQLLFRIDPAQFEARLAQAEAALASADAQKASAQAQLNKANRELRRVRPLAKKKLLSRSELDDASSDVEISKARVLIADAAIKLADANLTTATINLDYTQVRSPIDGIAGRALKTQGALTEVGSNSLMTTLVQIDPAYVNFGISEAEQIRMRSDLAGGKLLLPSSGFSVDLLNSDRQTIRSNGKIGFQDYKVDNSTGNFAVRATINNEDNLLSPGQFVRVKLTGAVRPNALAVPQRAVLDGPGGKYVYVMSKGEGDALIALQKTVVVGEWVRLEGELANGWIIKEGLVEGDQVIFDGSARIFYPGMAVKPKPAEASNQTTTH